MLKAEQAEVTIVAEVKKLEALLQYYEKFGLDDAVPSVNSQSVIDNHDALLEPKTEKERQAIIQVLSARLEAATARLEQATQQFKREKHLFEQGLTNAVTFDAAKAAFAEAEAAVKELNVKIDYYKSDPLEE